MRTGQNSFIFNRIAPIPLIFTGIAAVPAFLLQNNLLFQLIQLVSFFILAALAGKRIRIFPSFIILFSITLLNLFTPIGKILISVGRISVTAGALRLGVGKALTLIGLIYLSRATVRPDLRLPGRFGIIITKTFYYFDRITEQWRTIPKQPIIQRLDALLFQIYRFNQSNAEGKNEVSSPAKRTRTSISGYFMLFMFLSIQWGLFFLQFLSSWDPFQTL